VLRGAGAHAEILIARARRDDSSLQWMCSDERARCEPRGVSARVVLIAGIAGAIVSVLVVGVVVLLVGGLFGALNSYFLWLPRAFLKPHVGTIGWAFVGLAVVGAVWAGVRRLRLELQRVGVNPLLVRDLREGVVEERTLEIVEAMCVRIDEEHDGLGFLLREREGGVYFTIHEGSAMQSDVGWRTKVRGRDPRLDDERPGSRLVIVSTPHAKRLLHAELGGPPCAMQDEVYEGEGELARELGEAVEMSWEECVATYARDDNRVQIEAECPECDYDMSGVGPNDRDEYVCPECGAEVRASQFRDS
jgi:hypothetical protein